jgi:hypothetical protein
MVSPFCFIQDNTSVLQCNLKRPFVTQPKIHIGPSSHWLLRSSADLESKAGEEKAPRRAFRKNSVQVEAAFPSGNAPEAVAQQFGDSAF